MQDTKAIKFIFKGFLMHFDVMDLYMDHFKSANEMDANISKVIFDKNFTDLPACLPHKYKEKWYRICDILFKKDI